MEENKNKLTGVLLIEFGTPTEPTRKQVLEFISDLMTAECKVEPFFKRIFYTKIFPRLVYKTVMDQYKHIWLKDGSPLIVYSRRVAEGLKKALGPNFKVQLATVLNRGSIEKAVENLTQDKLSQLIVLPVFPHYSTFNKIYQEKIMKELGKLTIIPDVTMLSSLNNHPDYIATIAEVGKKYNLDSYDHVIFCYHSLPLNRDKKILDGYSKQCHEASSLIAEKLHLPAERYTTCFQSREGKEAWLEPYTENVLVKLVGQGKKKVLAFCPSWPNDCLETLYEVGVDYHELFKEEGGDTLELVPCINDHPMWIESLKNIVLKYTV